MEPEQVAVLIFFTGWLFNVIGYHRCVKNKQDWDDALKKARDETERLYADSAAKEGK